MADFDLSQLIYLIVLLIGIGGWFLMRNRHAKNKTLQFAAIWGLIFVGAAAAVGLWDDISRNSARQQIGTADGDQIILPRSRDGHYYLTAMINGQSTRFVVDTGAFDIVLTQTDAAQAGIDTDALTYPGRAMTANGEVRTAFVRLDEVRLGNVTDQNVSAVVNQGEMSQSLLGMGYLQRWGRIEISGGQMILTR